LPPDSVRAPVKKIDGREVVLIGDSESDEGGESINDFFGDDGPADEAGGDASAGEEEEREGEEEDDLDDFFG
jgi:hypothetical protein